MLRSYIPALLSQVTLKKKIYEINTYNYANKDYFSELKQYISYKNCVTN